MHKTNAQKLDISHHILYTLHGYYVVGGEEVIRYLGNDSDLERVFRGARVPLDRRFDHGTKLAEEISDRGGSRVSNTNYIHLDLHSRGEKQGSLKVDRLGFGYFHHFRVSLCSVGGRGR